MEIVIIFGNDNKELFIDNFIKAKGEALFCRELEKLKPYHKWLLLRKAPFSFYEQNLLIDCQRLFEVPLELRIGATYYRLEKPFDLTKKINSGMKLVWNTLASHN